MTTSLRSAVRRALQVSAAALLAFLPLRASASRFGVPSNPGGPPGYFVLTAQDAVNSTVNVALGDVAHVLTLYIENHAQGIQVDLYDPGLFNPALGPGQLDVNLGTPASAPATMRYQLFGPDGTGVMDALLADTSFGIDTAATDRQLVTLHADNRAPAGLYHLVASVVDGAALEQDVSVFGVSIPGKNAYGLGLTVGQVNEGGATIAEPLRAFPHVVRPSAGADAIGPLCGLQFVTFDLDAALNGDEPPFVELSTPSGFVFATSGASGDARWWEDDLGGIDPGPLDSSDHGAWTWSFSSLGLPEDCFGSLTPAHDFNAFAVQVLDYAAPPRDFTSWADLPSSPPFIVFNPDGPRRIYLPADGDGTPAKESLNHRAVITGGYPSVSLGQTSSLEVVVTLDNPTPYPLLNVVGRTHVAPSPELTSPVLVSSTGGLTATINAGDARRIDFTGNVAPGTTGEFRYRLDATPGALGLGFVTGDATDYLGASAPTACTYDTPFTNPANPELRQESQGPICQLAYVAELPTCEAVARLSASALRTCPGTPVTLDATSSEVFACPGGVAVYQWSVNGAIIYPYPAAASIDVTPLLNDTWEVAVGCSTDPANCNDVASVTFDLYPAPIVDAGADVAACAGSIVDLAAAISGGTPGYSNFRWVTTPPGQPGDGATSPTLSVTPTEDTVYTFLCDDAQGCTGSDEVAVDVRNPLPALSPDPPQLCGGSTVEIVAAAGFSSYAWTTAPAGASGDGATTPSVIADQGGVTYTCTVTDDIGCRGVQSVTTEASADPVPPEMNWSLRLEKQPPSDILHVWEDLAAPVSLYQLLAFDCTDANADRRCDADPTKANIAASSSFVMIAPGVRSSLEAGGLDRLPRLVFYKMRALSPCSQSPGPFATEPHGAP